MKPFQKRVIEEKAELDAKRDKLVDFFDTETFDDLWDDEKDRLILQKKAMDEYSRILGERIANFLSESIND
jgi:hypothetical protein